MSGDVSTAAAVFQQKREYLWPGTCELICKQSYLRHVDSTTGEILQYCVIFHIVNRTRDHFILCLPHLHFAAMSAFFSGMNTK